MISATRTMQPLPILPLAGAPERTLHEQVQLPATPPTIICPQPGTDEFDPTDLAAAVRRLVMQPLPQVDPS